MIKKLYFITAIIAVVMLSLITASADTGDVCGKIYSTDILALVNGRPIHSYNIGGKTAVIAEDLFSDMVNTDGNGVSYGFYGVYDDESRQLTLNAYYFQKYYTGMEGITVERGQVGTIEGDIYETDIKVLCNGNEIEGYNIGGRTAICIEDLGTLDDSENSKFGYSKYLANFTWDEETRTVALNTMLPNLEEIDFWHGLYNFNYTYTDNVLSAKYDPSNYYYSANYENNGSEEFAEEYFILKPFYIEAGGVKYEAGVCVRTKAWSGGHTLYHINDPEKTRELLISSIPPKMTYDEALQYLYNHPDYTFSDRFDNDDYTVLTLLVKEGTEKENAEKDGRVYFAVKKTGGYLLFADFSSYSPDISITLSLDGNTAKFSVYPFGGPHGPVTMITEYNLDHMQF